MSSHAGGGGFSAAKKGSWGAAFALASSSHPAPAPLLVSRPRAGGVLRLERARMSENTAKVNHFFQTQIHADLRRFELERGNEL